MSFTYDRRTPTNTTQEKLPSMERREIFGAEKRVSFGSNYEFLKSLLKGMNDSGSGGGMAIPSLVNAIRKWNEDNPTNLVKFNQAQFNNIAKSQGSITTINREDLYITLGVTQDERIFSRNKEFLKFLESSFKKGASDGGYTIQEIQNAAGVWNKMHPSKPEVHVYVSKNAFEQLARRDTSQTGSGAITISKEELRFFARGALSSTLPEKTQNQIAFGDLSKWKNSWDTLKLPFAYQEFRDGVTASLMEGHSGFRTENGRAFAIQDAMRMVTEKTGITSFEGTKTLIQAELDGEASHDPFKMHRKKHEEHQKGIAEYHKNINCAVEIKEKQLGRQMNPDEKKYFIRGFEMDKLIRSIIEAPEALYERITGINDPYAKKANEFIGGLIAGVPTILKQITLGVENPEMYLRDVFSNLPSNIGQILTSLNIFDPNIPGEERFSRALNIVAILAAGKGKTLSEIAKEPPSVQQVFVSTLGKVRPSRNHDKVCQDIAKEMEKKAESAPGAESDEKIVKRYAKDLFDFKSIKR